MQFLGHLSNRFCPGQKEGQTKGAAENADPLGAWVPAEERGRRRAGWQLKGTPEDLKGPKAARLQPGQPGIYRKPLLRLGNGTSYGMKVGLDPSHLN